jgi:predicted ArsR family transcriptional regulator
MRPETTSGGGGPATESEGGVESFDAWRALQKATDKKRANLIADIVGHPVGAPTVEELAYMNPSLSEDSIRRHLATLVEVGVVESHALPEGKRLREFPYTFYTLTDEARTLFDRNDLFPEPAWQRQYAAVKKTARVREVQEMPRPAEIE